MWIHKNFVQQNYCITVAKRKTDLHVAIVIVFEDNH